MRFDRLPALVVGRGHQRRAQPANRLDLRSRRGVHHHHRAGNAGVPGRERDALAGVAGADRPDAVAPLVRTELPDGVMRAADLERSPIGCSVSSLRKISVVRRMCRSGR